MALTGNGVAFDAGDLHQPADGVAGQTEVVFDPDFGSVFHLFRGTTFQSRRRRRHGARRSDFTLAADLCPGDGGIIFIQNSDRGRGQKETVHAVLVCSGAKSFVIAQDRRKIPAAPLVGAVRERGIRRHFLHSPPAHKGWPNPGIESGSLGFFFVEIL